MRCSGGGRQEFLTLLSAKPETVMCKAVSEELIFIIEKPRWTEQIAETRKQQTYSIHLKRGKES